LGRRWRLVVFDIPESSRSLRTHLRAFLRDCRFGWLQNSVWISPDPVDAFRQELGETGLVPESLTYFEARPVGGESPAALVNSAWDIARLRRTTPTIGRFSECARIESPAPRPGGFDGLKRNTGPGVASRAAIHFSPWSCNRRVILDRTFGRNGARRSTSSLAPSQWAPKQRPWLRKRRLGGGIGWTGVRTPWDCRRRRHDISVSVSTSRAK